METLCWKPAGSDLRRLSVHLEIAMAKTDWQTRWQDTLTEKLRRFTVSSEREELGKWLENAGFAISFATRSEFSGFTMANEEVARTLDQDICPYPAGSTEEPMWRWCRWLRTDEYRRFRDECKRAGMRYGLDWRTILQALFLPVEEVEIEPHVRPRWYLESVFSYRDEDTMDRLERTMPPGTALRWGSELPLESQEASSDVPTADIFKIVVECPLDFPREGALQMTREATRAAHVLCKALGRQPKRRIKGKPTLEDAKRLRLDRPRLSSGEVYDIIDDIYGEDSDPTKDQERRKRISSRRYKGKKHLSEP